MRIHRMFWTAWTFLVIACVSTNAAPLALRVVHKSQPMAVVMVDEGASEVLQYAADELCHFVATYTNAQLPIVSNTRNPQWAIHLLLNPRPDGRLIDAPLSELGPEAYALQSLDHASGATVRILGNTPRAVLYGVYAFLDICLEQVTGFSPVDPDFPVQPVSELTIPPLSRVGHPFYSRRVSLAPKTPDWLSRHRFNISGAEGVWSGTGSDDGLGTAVKYLEDPAFESLQDEPANVRRERRDALHARLAEMRRRGIDTFLFMYVTGEPTEAMIRAHPDWFGPPVSYRDARNRSHYYPFCWSNPDTRGFLVRLAQALVREYPELTGFHFRSWGAETRACNCDECGGTSPAGQELLWQLYFELIDAARAVRPDFQFYISGYNRSWLKDPDYTHAAQLPVGTILTQKWAVDGEPVADVGLSIAQLEAIGQSGQEMVILSHNVEEVAPFWMVESDLFAEGVRDYASRPGTQALSGFTLQGTVGLGYMDQLVSGFLNWDPSADYVAYLRNFLTSRYGPEAAPFILDAVRLNAKVLSAYFEHYAHSLALSGGYGAGSGGTASRFWSLIGDQRVREMLAIPEYRLVELAQAELRSFYQMQQEARRRMDSAEERIDNALVEPAAMEDYEDGRALMELWEHFFASRWYAVNAVWLGWTGGSAEEVADSLSRALAASRAMVAPISRYHQFFLLFGYSNEGMRRLLLDELAGEWPVFEQFDWHPLDRAAPDVQVTIPEANGWATKREITIRIVAQDRFSGLVPGAMMQIREGEEEWPLPEPYQSERLWQLTHRDGRHTVSVRVSDNLGNWSPTLSTDVLLDTTPPYGSIRPANPVKLQNERVTQLHINAFDEMSRVDTGGQIRLSHDGIHWEEPIPYQPLIFWEWSPGDGEKWVYALYRDLAGNWMESPVSASIVLDTQPPDIIATVPVADASNVDFRIPRVEMHFSEPLDLRETPTIGVRGTASGPIAIETSIQDRLVIVALHQTLAPQETVTVTLLSRIPDQARNMLSSGYTFSFQTAAALLPGDTNRDGRVDVDDLHTVIRYQGKSGHRRASMSWRYWQAQAVPAWDVPEAAYADANGDGHVSMADVLPIALHWGKTRPWAVSTGNWQLTPRYAAEYEQMLALIQSSVLAAGDSRALATQLTRFLHSEQVIPRTQLLAPFPNPSSGEIRFPLQLGKPADITIRIFDQRGYPIRTLFYANAPAGFHDTPDTAPVWDGTDANGLSVSSGTYWVQTQIGTQRRRFTIVLLR